MKNISDKKTKLALLTVRKLVENEALKTIFASGSTTRDVSDNHDSSTSYDTSKNADSCMEHDCVG